MCRIAGIVNHTIALEEIQTCVKEMCCLQQHGGPDDEGFYSSANPNIVLGHRRLSIIDLSEKAHQPMSYANNRYHITFNGEIYNYKELRKELEQSGSDFFSNSDTEVILAAFAKWGVESFEKLDGMFAFGLWDSATSEIYLVRDANGIKPLYYSTKNNALAFASEVQALTVVPGLNVENPTWKIFFMAFGHLPEPITTLQDVVPLKKGNYLKYNAVSGQLSLDTFFQFRYIEKIENRKDAIELVKNSLHAAVKRHLISDAPIGVFLSGGLDSSIIALLADADEQSRLNTISIFFEDKKYSEKNYQDLIQKKLYCNNHQHLVSEADFHHYLPSIFDSMDLPSCDGINTWFISKHAKLNGLKAVLSGIGSDELFGGYPSFNRMNATLMLEKLPNQLLRSAKYIGHSKYRRLQYLCIPGTIGKYLFLRGQFVPKEIAAYLNLSETEVWKILEETLDLESISHLSPKNQASWMEINLYMQNQLLRDADVMSMAHGIEIRVPFLDMEFKSLVLKLDSDIKYSGSLPKQLLIDAYKNGLPEKIWNRPKMGFTFPFKEWLKNDEFAKSHSDKMFSDYFERFSNDQLHWSQFFSLLLLEKK